jgi:hypothetical protein
MPSVMDAPEYEIEYIDTHDLTIETRERPRSRQTRPGFWRTLAHGITKHSTRTPRVRQAPSCSMHRPFETPMDRFVREHPSLAPLALSII